MTNSRVRLAAVLLVGTLIGGIGIAQTPPEIAYLVPPCGAPGQTVDVILGGYNWTPDVQFLLPESQLQIQLSGPPSRVLVPEPPYWFGKKARDNDLPLPREFPAKITIPADTKPGMVAWHAANANGAAVGGTFLICEPTAQDVREMAGQTTQISMLPAAVIGQLTKLEEVDEIVLVAPRAGLVTLDVQSRKFGSKLNAIVTIEDEQRRLVADAADTAGHDLSVTFLAVAGAKYTVRMHDADFRGHPSFVYRAVFREGARILATRPAKVAASQPTEVELIGIGVATGQLTVETVRAVVTPPASTATDLIGSFEQPVTLPNGPTVPYRFATSTLPERREDQLDRAAPITAFPIAITGTLEQFRGEDRYTMQATKDTSLTLRCESAKAGSPLDLTLAVLDAAGQELVRTDDLAATLDAGLDFKFPADGPYQIVVSDQSGQSGELTAVYRLRVSPSVPDFELTTVDRLPVPLGEVGKLVVKLQRHGGFAEPVELELQNLPSGLTPSTSLVIPADKSELSIDLTCAADAACTAQLVRVVGRSAISGQAQTRQAPPSVIALTMKPRTKITPVGLDDVRKWPRGSTYLAPVIVERLEGYTGEVLLEQTAHQQRVRQGIWGPDFMVPAGVTAADYPVFLPEWLETTKTSRIILNGVVQAPDPKGNVRHLLNKMELRIGMLPVGALLKVAHTADDLVVKPDASFAIPFEISRATELSEEVQVELQVPAPWNEGLVGQPVRLPAGTLQGVMMVERKGGCVLPPELTVTLRATALRDGQWPVVSESTCRVTVE